MKSPYAEAAYFDGYHVQHIADYYERKRLDRAHEQCRQLARRRQSPPSSLRLASPPDTTARPAAGGRDGRDFPPVGAVRPTTSQEREI